MSDNEMMNLEELGNLKEDFEMLEEELMKNERINPNLYIEYDVKRGLRDSAGKGVLTGLTEISDVCAYNLINGRRIPAEGKLYYQGVDVEDIVKGLEKRKFGFEETIYLLLFGKLPNEEELNLFLNVMFELQGISGRFVRDVVMKASNANIMNAMQRCILTLYTYDAQADDISAGNVLRQCLELIAKVPLIAVYSYHSYRHFRKDDTLLIRNPKKGLSLAENILLMLRPDGQYTELEAKVLDIALILHAEHGGGNNSSFTTHLISSTGTDTYSAISAAIGSLTGPKHGGANIAVINMIADIKAHVPDFNNRGKLDDYLVKILKKEANDKTGLVYGMGHAIYTLSDPRAKLLKSMSKKLAENKNLVDDFLLCDYIERRTPQLYAEVTGIEKPMPANVDLYSGFVYDALDIPVTIATPLFATARLSGWCAHRIEELVAGGKLMRPAYNSVQQPREYINIKDRTSSTLPIKK